MLASPLETLLGKQAVSCKEMRQTGDWWDSTWRWEVMRCQAVQLGLLGLSSLAQLNEWHSWCCLEQKNHPAELCPKFWSTNSWERINCCYCELISSGIAGYVAITETFIVGVWEMSGWQITVEALGLILCWHWPWYSLSFDYIHSLMWFLWWLILSINLTKPWSAQIIGQILFCKYIFEWD